MSHGSSWIGRTFALVLLVLIAGAFRAQPLGLSNAARAGGGEGCGLCTQMMGGGGEGHSFQGGDQFACGPHTTECHFTWLADGCSMWHDGCDASHDNLQSA